MTNYITLAEVKNYLKINSVEHDARFANLITYGCSVIQNYCGRIFASNTYTETFDGGTSSVFLHNIPVNNVHQVTEFDGSQYQVLDGPTLSGLSVEAIKTSKSVSSQPGFSLQDRYVKFGTTSAQFNGTSGYISVADNDDFWFDSLPFAVEGWFRFNTFTTSQTVVSQVEDANNYWKLEYSNVNGLSFTARSAGTEIANVSHLSTAGYTLNQFTHLAMSRDVNNDCRIFRNGNLLATVAVANTLPNLSGAVEIARQNLSDKQWFNGQADEIRISLNEPRFTANFTPQTYQYATDSSTVLLLHFNGARSATSTQDSSISREQYQWYPDTGEITRHVGEDSARETMSLFGTRKFYNYPRGVRVTYNGGYDTVPYDIKLATLDYVKELHKGIESKQVSLQGESMIAFDYTNGFAPHIRRVLDLYRVIM